MKILFVFERKGTAFFLYSQTKLKKNAIFRYFSTISPRKVAAVASKTRTCTSSPICLPARGKTTVLYWEVRPNISSWLRLEKPSTSTSTVLPISRRLLASDNSFCRAIISFLGDVVRQVFLGVSARALAVFEHERRVEAHLAHQAQRLGMVFERLIVETAEDICAYGGIG